MTRIPEAERRMFKRVFVCRKCKTKIKANAQKIRQKKILCRRCKSRAFRPIKKEKKVIK